MIDRLFSMLRKDLYASARRQKNGINSPRFDTSDIAQEGMIKLWITYQNRLDSFEANKSYLNCVSKGVLANEIRFHSADKRDTKRVVSSEIEFVDYESCDPQDSVEEAENFRLMLECLARLQADQRRAFEMHVFNGSRHKEIAAELDVTVDVVRTLIKNAKKELRSGFSDLRNPRI